MKRRSFVKILLGGTALVGLAGCVNGQLQLPTIPVSVSLSAGVQTFINNVNEIIGKLQSLGSDVGPAVTVLEGQATTLIGQITTGGYVTGLGTELLNVLADIVPLLPTPYGEIASAILALIPTLAALVPNVSMSALSVRTRPKIAMTVDQAWQVIRSR